MRETPVLAQAAGLLSPALEAQLRRLPEALGAAAGRIERAFVRRAGRLDPRQRKALALITAGAAGRLLAEGGTLAGFIEQVEYNGRRLAKLDLPPGAVLGALQDYRRLLEPALEPALRSACEQLHLAVMLTLNNAFYQVREAETQAMFALTRLALEAPAEAELLEGALATLAEFCRADAACLFVLDKSGTARRAASRPRAGPLEVRVRAGDLSQARLLGGSSHLALDPGWRGRFASFWSVPVRSGRTLAIMQFAFVKPYEWLPREFRLLAAAAEHFLLAWQKQTLAAELAARERQVRELARRMMEVEERERRRISRELHDETGQLLLYLRLKLEMLAAAAPEAFKPGLEEARQLIEGMVVEIRRLISDLSPTVLAQAGLSAAVRQLIARFRSAHGIPVRLAIGRLGRLPDHTEILVYRLLQECSSNIARHAQASAVNISLRSADGKLKLAVEDNGVGFQLDQMLRRRGSFGLAGMRERVELAGGRLAITSRLGGGTKVKVELPVPRTNAAAAGTGNCNGKDTRSVGR